MQTLKDFIHDPQAAVLHGYNPSLMCCMCWVATCFGRDALRIQWEEFKDLRDVSVAQFLPELAICLFIAAVLFSIPLGGFVLLGAFARFTVYRPSRMKARRAAELANL